jgi:hypothetical protein
MALGLDYWVLPQISSGYFANYKATEENVAAAIRLVKHIVDTKGWANKFAPQHGDL